MKKKKSIVGVIYVVFVLIFFTITAIGYGISGATWYDATYYSAQTFLLNYTAVENTHILIYFGRVLCPIMTATGLFLFLRNVFKGAVDWFVSGLKDSTAIYYDSDSRCEVGKNFKRPVMMGTKKNRRVRSHVLLLDKDLDNLSFYEQLKDYIKKDSKVYIKLEETDSKLLEMSDVYYFNVNEIIARTYWQKRNLQKYLKEGRLEVKIAILGFDSLGQNLLDYGLMNNIYSMDQSIQYHVWGMSGLYRKQLGDFDKMNGDTITYYDGDWWNQLAQLKDFDRIIVAQETNVELLQALLYLSSDAEIDFYNPEGTKLSKLYKSNKLMGYGVLSEILTEDSVKTDKLYREAKEVNYGYVVKYDESGTYTWQRTDVEAMLEEQWQMLDGFTKGSNISCADYHNIRRLVMEAMGMDKNMLSEDDMEILAEMEHVRWSRYHYVNHWSYVSPEEMPPEKDGKRKSKNAVRRVHTLLLPYANLSEEEKEKDKVAIRELLEGR